MAVPQINDIVISTNSNTYGMYSVVTGIDPSETVVTVRTTKNVIDSENYFSTTTELANTPDITVQVPVTTITEYQTPVGAKVSKLAMATYVDSKFINNTSGKITYWEIRKILIDLIFSTYNRQDEIVLTTGILPLGNKEGQLLSWNYELECWRIYENRNPETYPWSPNPVEEGQDTTPSNPDAMGPEVLVTDPGQTPVSYPLRQAIRDWFPYRASDLNYVAITDNLNRDHLLTKLATNNLLYGLINQNDSDAKKAGILEYLNEGTTVGESLILTEVGQQAILDKLDTPYNAQTNPITQSAAGVNSGILYYLGYDTILNYLGVNNILSFLGRQPMVNYLNGGTDSTDSYSDGYHKVNSTILDTIGLDELKRFLGQQATLTWLDTPITATPATDTGFITNDPIIQTISRDELMQSINRDVANGVDSKLYQLSYLGQQTILDFLDIHYGIKIGDILRFSDGDFTLPKLDIKNTYNKVPTNIASGFKLESSDHEMEADFALAWTDGTNTYYSNIEFVPGSTVSLYSSADDIYGNSPVTTETLSLDTTNLITFYRYVCKETNEEVWLTSTTPTQTVATTLTYICPSETLTTYEFRDIQIFNTVENNVVTEVWFEQTINNVVYKFYYEQTTLQPDRLTNNIDIAPVKLGSFTRDPANDAIADLSSSPRTVNVLYVNPGSASTVGGPITDYNVAHAACTWKDPNRNYDIIHNQDRKYRMNSMVTRIFGFLKETMDSSSGDDYVAGCNTLSNDPTIAATGYVYLFASSYGNGDVEFQMIPNRNVNRERELIVSHFNNLANLGYRGFNTGLVNVGYFEVASNVVREIYNPVTSDELSYYRGTITGVSRSSIRNLSEGAGQGPHDNTRFPRPNNTYDKIIIPYGFEILFDKTGFVGFNRDDYYSVFLAEDRQIDLPTVLLDEEGHFVTQKAGYLVARIVRSGTDETWNLTFEWRDEFVEGSESATTCMLGSCIFYEPTQSDPVHIIPNSWLFYPWLSTTSQEERVNSGVKIQSGSPAATDTDDQGVSINTLQFNVNAGRIMAEGIQINDTSKLSYFDFDYTKNVMSTAVYPNYYSANRPASNVWLTNIIYDKDSSQAVTIQSTDPEWGKWAILVPGVGPMGPEGGVFYYIPQGKYSETEVDSNSQTYHYADAIFDDIEELWKAVASMEYETKATSSRFIPLPAVIAVKIGYAGVSTDSDYVQFKTDIPEQFTRFVSVSEPSSSVMRTGLSFYDNGGLVGLAYGSNGFNVSIPASTDSTNDLKYDMRPAVGANTQIDLDMHVPRRSLVIPGTYNAVSGVFTVDPFVAYNVDSHPNVYDIYQDTNTNTFFRWANNQYIRITGTLPVIVPGTSGSISYDTNTHKFVISSKLLTGAVGEVFGVVFNYNTITDFAAGFDSTIATQQVQVVPANGTALSLNMSADYVKTITGIGLTTTQSSAASIIARALTQSKGIIWFYRTSTDLHILNSTEFDDSSVPSTSSNNTWTGTQTFSNSVSFTGSVSSSQVIQGTALRAEYADLAEYYRSDAEYKAGTVVMFGGKKEITVATDKANAIISTKPGLELNGAEVEGEIMKPIALTGRVPVRVAPGIEINKFDSLYLSRECPGTVTNISYGQKLGIALESGKELILATVQLSL